VPDSLAEAPASDAGETPGTVEQAPSSAGDGRGRKGRSPAKSPTLRAEEALKTSLRQAAEAKVETEKLHAARELETDGFGAQLAAIQERAMSDPAAHGAGGLNFDFGFAFWLALAWVGLVILAAIFANLLPLSNPNQPAVGPFNQAPTWQHLFGTDNIGHDLFSQVVFGGRVSMIIGGSSVAVGLTIGGLLGIMAGFYKGIVDVIVVWVTDLLLTLPGLIFALTLVAFLGQTLRNVVIAISVLSIPAYARIARAASLAVSQRDFVLASLSLGAKPRRILFREVMPLVAIPIVSFIPIGASVAILAEGALAYLGLSASNELSWGAMIAAGQQELNTAPQAVFAPIIAFFLTVMALNYVGQKAGAALDPRQARF
jgi:peptide/nickel transport system permease protein